jgi:hypothetical protein
MRHLRIKAPAFDVEIILQRQPDGVLERQRQHTLAG